MKRRLLIAAVFVLAGAVVNVAVAWGCAARSPVGDEERVFPVPSNVSRWFVRYCPLDVDLPDDSDVRERRGLGVRLRHMGDWIEDVETVLVSRRTTAGLPLPSLDGEIWELGSLGSASDVVLSDCRYLPVSIGPVQIHNVHYGAVLPLRPIWPGFAVNTIFYAAFLWLLILGPFALRRLIRIRRGLCPACAYPRGESDVCSECGVRPGRYLR